MVYRVLLADDHSIVREGIRTLINQLNSFLVIGEASDGFEAIEACRQLKPDIVLIDIGMPRVNGIRATASILKHSPTTKVIVLSMYDDDVTVLEAIRAGARGYVLKTATGDVLRAALKTVARGQSYLCPGVAGKVVLTMQQGRRSLGDSPLERLAPREREVLRLVAEGKTSKEVATILQLGLETVRGYRKTLMSKLNVHNVAGLTQFALATGLIDLEAFRHHEE